MRYHEQIVLAIMLDDTRPLKESGLISLALEDMLVSTLDNIAEVRLKLHQFTSAINNIHAIVVIEEKRAVVEMAHT